METRYYENYKGIVIQNDDPDKVGRVKVFVPQISMTLYKGWNEDRENDKIFTGLGANINSALVPDILDRLKKSLPWARVKQPIFGMSTGLTYHADKDFSEIGNDSDNATQHQETNKNDVCSLPSQNNLSSLSNAVKETASAPPNSSDRINNYNNNLETPEFIKNSALSDPQTSSPTNTTPEEIDDNINSVTITFTPNSRNSRNLHRRFTTSFETSDGEFQTVGASSTGFTRVFGSGSTSQSINSLPYTPPITYTPANPGNISNSSGATNPFVITFIPNARNALGNNANRRFTTSASIISYDGQTITAQADATGLRSTKTFTIDKSEIDNIDITYNDPSKPVDLNSDRFGGLSPLMQEYTSVPSGPTSSAIMPPMPIASSGGCNRGGGGGEMFTIIWTGLIPLFGIFNNLISGPNLNCKTAINHGKKLSKQIDPNETIGSNLQNPADAKEPIRAPTQNNKVKGMISIPAVGAIVSVYFDNGDPLYPIVDGWFPTQEDFMGIHDVAQQNS